MWSCKLFNTHTHRHTKLRNAMWSSCCGSDPSDGRTDAHVYRQTGSLEVTWLAVYISACSRHRVANTARVPLSLCLRTLLKIKHQNRLHGNAADTRVRNHSRLSLNRSWFCLCTCGYLAELLWVFVFLNAENVFRSLVKIKMQLHIFERERPLSHSSMYNLLNIPENWTLDLANVSKIHSTTALTSGLRLSAQRD